MSRYARCVDLNEQRLRIEAERERVAALAEDFRAEFGQTETDLSYSARGRYARGYFEEHLCYVPWLHIFIAWNGDVFLCCMARGKTDPLGNVRRTSVAEVFNGEPYRRIRAQFRTAMPAVCHRCDMFVTENSRVERLLSLE